MLYQRLILVCLLGISNIVLAGRTGGEYTSERIARGLVRAETQSLRNDLQQMDQRLEQIDQRLQRMQREALTIRPIQHIAILAAGTVGVAGLVAIQQQRQNNNQPCTIL